MTFHLVPVRSDGNPLEPFTMTVRPTVTTEDESLRNIVAWVVEVRLGGTPVWGERFIVHANKPQHLIEAEARDRAHVGFGTALRHVFGYRPEEM